MTYEFIHCESPICTIPGKPGCERQPFLCVPESWSKKEIAKNFGGETRKFLFLDSNTINNGKDNDWIDGLEQAGLIFYAGHGTPGKISSKGHNMAVRLDKMSLGDCHVRYWWMLSCKVMAHGPSLATPNGKAVDYLAPEKFDRGDASNVFREWGEIIGLRKPLNPNLRMACGGSTDVGGYFSFPTASIWHYKLMPRLPVADSFLLGLTRFYHVPICITRGNEEREKTPLYDQEFSQDPNPAPDGEHIFIQYPVHLNASLQPLANVLKERFSSAAPHPPSDAAQEPPPRKLPVLKVGPTPLPDWLKEVPQSFPVLPYGYRGGGADRFFSPAAAPEAVLPGWGGALRARDVCVKVQPRSGAVTLAWTPSNLTASPELRERLLSGEDLFELVNDRGAGMGQLTGPVEGEGTVKRLQPEIDVLQMNIDGALTSEALKPEFSRAQIDRHTKCIYVRLSAWIEVEGRPTRVFGEGSEWLLGGCPRTQSLEGEALLPPDGNVCQSKAPSQLSLSWVGRAVSESPVDSDTLIRVGKARREARRRLGRYRREYQEPNFRWGYKAAPVHCSQSHMYLVYLFDFLPKDDDRYRGNLPITIEIPAHKLPEGKTIEDDWVCDPEAPKAEPEG